MCVFKKYTGHPGADASPTPKKKEIKKKGLSRSLSPALRLSLSHSTARESLDLLGLTPLSVPERSAVGSWHRGLLSHSVLLCAGVWCSASASGADQMQE